MVLKIHGHAVAPLVRLVAEVCKEKEIPYELVNVAVYKGEHKTPAFREFQPFCQVPYIVRGDNRRRKSYIYSRLCVRMTRGSSYMSPEQFVAILSRSTKGRGRQDSFPRTPRAKHCSSKPLLSNTRTSIPSPSASRQRKSSKSQSSGSLFVNHRLTCNTDIAAWKLTREK